MQYLLQLFLNLKTRLSLEVAMTFCVVFMSFFLFFVFLFSFARGQRNQLQTSLAAAPMLTRDHEVRIVEKKARGHTSSTIYTVVTY